MNLNNFTIKSQEAIEKAANIVQVRNQQAIEPIHLLKAIMETGETVTNFIFNKFGANTRIIASAIDKTIDSLPKVSGGEPYLSRESNNVLQKADEYSKKAGDEFVSIEFIFLAILNVKSNASSILKDAGLTEDGTQSAINELRKGNKVSSQSAEDTYNSLNKYAINLNEKARRKTRSGHRPRRGDP